MNDLERNLPTRLASKDAPGQTVLWSPDGKHVLFQTRKEDTFGLYQIAANGVGTEELLLKGGNEPTDWSFHGDFILFSPSTNKTRGDVWVLPLSGDRQPYALLNATFELLHPQLSPRWELAGVRLGRIGQL